VIWVSGYGPGGSCQAPRSINCRLTTAAPFANGIPFRRNPLDRDNHSIICQRHAFGAIIQSLFFTDQTGRTIALDSPPRRIVSLVPSQTELLSDLGLEEEVVGITKFCVHPPEWRRLKTKVGGTKQVKMDVVEKLNPDLIIGNKEENEKDQIEGLSRRYPVWMSDIYTLEDAQEMIGEIGRLTGRENRAQARASEIETLFGKLPGETALFPELKSAYFIWRDPYMVAGSRTFIHDMMRRAGFANVFGHLLRYPAISLKELEQAEPQIILLSSEPYPFKTKHIEEFRQACPNAVIRLVDGEMFSWYGSRLRLAPAYFRQLMQSIRQIDDPSAKQI
jgi:ABC-type Fe3+-hydroxamate transport system substrate-binding protein